MTSLRKKRKKNKTPYTQRRIKNPGLPSKPVGNYSSDHWEYDAVHPYDIDGSEHWCDMPTALLVTGLVVFIFILVIAVSTGGHHHDDDDHHDKRSITTEYTRMINSLQRGIDQREWETRCPVGSHAWHPQGTLEEPACRVNYPWPTSADQQLIRPDRLDESLKNENDPCRSFEAYACHGWHLSDPTKGRVGSTEALPASRGFSELGYRNLNLRLRTRTSDVGFVDTTWNRRQTTRSSDNRIYFHEFVSSCANSLSGKFDDLGAFGQRVKELMTVRNDADSRLGYMFGRAQCHGAAPVVYAMPGLDATDKEREVLYVEPMGILGVRSILLREDADAYKKKHVAMISLACRVLVDLKLHKNVNTCTSDALAVEDLLVWNGVSSARDGGLFETSSAKDNMNTTKPTIDEQDFPIIEADRPPFFTSDWWKAYEHGLMEGGCMSLDSLEYVQRAPVWTNSLEYVENLDHVIKGGDSVCSTKQWKNFLRVSLALDYLEHASPGRLDLLLEDKKEKERENLGNPEGGPHSVSKPWTDETPHIRGFHSLHTHGHFGASSKKQTTSMSDTVASYVNAFVLKKPRRGTHTNAESSDWELEHYVTVDQAPDTERHLAFWSKCTVVGDLYLQGIQDDSFAAVVTSKEERDKIHAITKTIIDALVESIQGSELLSSAAKGNLTQKARAIAVRVAVPWHGREQPSYSGAGIRGDSFYFDSNRVRLWNMRRVFEKTFSPASVMSRRSSDATQREGNNVEYHFGMSTSAVNAYYSPEENSINILAGILGPPFYDSKYNNASLYATIGAVIGHELSHGFDSEGVKFDAKGSRRSWLSQEDERAYEGREQCFIDRYDRKTRLKNTNDGKRTITENIADTMGLRAALRAFLAQGQPLDMKTAMREFVESYGQAWCVNQTPQGEQRQIDTDVHSPANVRVDGALSSLRTPDGRSPLSIAYGCAAEDRMVREEPCTLW